MTERATAPEAAGRGAHKGPLTLLVLLDLAAIGLFAAGWASGLQTHGFSWWRVVGVFVFGMLAGFWVCALGPVRRWTARRFD